MNIISRMREERTGFCKPDRIRLSADFSEVEGSAQRYSTHSVLNEYVVKLTIATNYFANSAQHAHGEARRMAERRLMQELYGDVLDELSIIEHAVTSADDQSVLEACSRLRTKLTHT